MALTFPKLNQLRFHVSDGIEWFLPSTEELVAMYTNLHLNTIGGFAAGVYWSSSENSATQAIQVSFINGVGGPADKTTTNRVRACRTFVSKTTHAIGSTGPADGFIFYRSGNTYWEASKTDISASQTWSSVAATAVTGTAQTIGSGYANTALIIAQPGQSAPSAASICYSIYLPYYEYLENHDNRAADFDLWAGVYPHVFYQPILNTWRGIVGDGNELDFVIHSSLATWAAENKTVNVYKLTDADPLALTLIEALTPTDFYTYSSGIHVYRFTKSLAAYTDGLYVVKIITSPQTAQQPLYESNVFEVGSWFDDCMTFSGTNFENDFGIAWINSTPTTWYLKLLMPYRMYKPAAKVEKEVYNNDGGVQTTLRSTIQRKFEFESLPVPIWYAELFQMATALSTTYLNRIAINFEDIPTIEVISESNLAIVKGVVTLTAFNDLYLLNV
jgi:hypothetical protein